MSDWQETTLGDVLELKRGYDLPNSERRRGNVPIISSSGPSGFHDEAKAKAPGVVTGRYGTVGQVFYIQNDFWPLNTSLYVHDFKGNDPKFVYYLLQRIDWLQFSDKSSVPGVNRNDAHKAFVKIPPIDHQKAIAAVLGALDDKIELNRRMNTTLEAMARALFKSWFVDFDPVRAKMEGKQPFGMDAATAALFPSRLVPSSLGDIPEGWDIVPVIDSAEFINGAAYKNMHFSDAPDALPVIKIAELKNGISPGTQYTNSDLGEKFRLDTGDILFSWSGSPDTSIDTFIYTGGPAWLNQHIFKVVSENNEKRCFTYWLLKYLKPTFIEIARDKQTTGLGHVTRADMQRLKFAEPSEDIVNAFYQKAGALMDSIQSNLSQAEQLAKTRDYLLPKLISGDIRIPDAEKFVEAA